MTGPFTRGIRTVVSGASWKWYSSIKGDKV
jgi:hypothetical protein